MSIGSDEAAGALAQASEIFTRGPVVVFRWGAKPGWPVEYVSPNVEEVFGHTAEDFVIGRVAYADIVRSEDLPRVTSEVALATDSHALFFRHEPYRVAHAVGRDVWLDDHTMILRDASGKAIHYVGYVIDITDRIHAEEDRDRYELQAIRSQKMESMGILAGAIAHDFNNYLTTIVGNAELAMAQVSPDSDVHQAMQLAVSSAERAGELCRQLLVYAGHGRSALALVKLETVVQEMSSLLKVTAGERVTIATKFADNVPAVLMDATQLRQVVMNLVTNARDALGGGGGAVRLETEFRQLGHEDLRSMAFQATDGPGDFVCLCVDDAGNGMSPSTLRRLFDPFFSTKPTGRGLGMASVLGIVRAHHGAVRVQSAPGEGSKIEVFFPCKSSEYEALRDPLGHMPVESKRRLALLIEDEREVHRVTRRALESGGYEVASAFDGAEGLERLDELESSLHLVVLDVRMPRCTGIDVLRQIRARLPQLPVVMISGFSEQDIVAELHHDPYTIFIPKPFTRQVLLDGIASLVGVLPNSLEFEGTSRPTSLDTTA